ncbi:SDR family NAD(P)-dependent oxidoreductase [Limosilactobacillus fermentum]
MGLGIKKGGVILTVTSLAGAIALPFGGMYNADKWATTGLSETLYYELRPYNIRVRTFVPGAVFTSFVKNEDANDIADNPMRTNTVKILIPDGLDKMEQIDEAVDDLYTAATDDDPDRMVYVTGQTAKEIYQKRQEMGDEAFRKYFAKLLLAE